MPRWNKALWVALGSFFGAILLIGLAMWLYLPERAEHLASAAPLPPPGQTATIAFSPAENWRRYSLGLEVSVPPTNSATLPEFAPPPCDLQVRFKQGDTVERTEWFRVHQVGAAESIPAALFSSGVMEFSPGDRTVEITNLGCDQGYQFIGGVLQMRRVSPVMFSRTIFPLLGAIALALIGVFSTLAGVIGLRATKRAIAVPTAQ
jgi:hypothetical protein